MIVHGLLRINIISQLYLSRSLPLPDSISVMPIANEPHRGREREWVCGIVCIFFLFPSLLRLLFSFHTLKIHCNLCWYGVGCVFVVCVYVAVQQQQTYLYSVWSMLSFKRVHYHCQQHTYRYVFTVRWLWLWLFSLNRVGIGIVHEMPSCAYMKMVFRNEK